VNASIQAYVREAASRGRETLRVGPFLVTITADTDNPYLNYAIPDDGAQPTASDVVALMDAFHQRQRRPRLEYLPSCAPGVEAPLVANGFHVDGRLPLMLCSPSTLIDVETPVGALVERAESEADLLAVVTVQHEAYEDPPATVADARRLGESVRLGAIAMLARDVSSGEPAGAATCSVPRDGTTEVAGVAVRERFGRRGIAGAVAARLTRAGFDRGVTLAFLTPEYDYTERLYARIGYSTGGTVLHISLPPSSSLS
jgi:Acetyltransferase (GNAT) family